MNAFGSTPSLTLITPKSPEEALTALAIFKDQQGVILNLTLLTPAQGQRFLDWVAGGVCASDGHPFWLGERTYLFLPPSFQASVPEHFQSSFAPKLVS